MDPTGLDIGNGTSMAIFIWKWLTRIYRASLGCADGSSWQFIGLVDNDCEKHSLALPREEIEI